MGDENVLDTKSVMETLEAIQRTLESLNAAPNTAAPAATRGVDDQATQAPSKFLSRSDVLAVRRELRTKKTDELEALFFEQALRKDVGVPAEIWANAGGYAVQNQLMSNPQIAKALDTSGATALIRQDLEPVLYELYIREFPAFDRLRREPANGLVHAFNQVTDYGSARFMAELGTVTDDLSTYTRQTTNVAILATRRGISLKSQFAVQAGGMSWSPEALELQGGLRAMAHEMQKAIFQGNSSTSGGAGASTELGAYDANAFDGLRRTLNTARAQNVDPTAGTPEDMRAAIDRAAEQIVEQGGSANVVYCHPHEKVSFDLQQDKNVRYLNLTEVTPGVQTTSVNTVLGALPLLVVKGDSIGTYTATSTYSGNTVRDMYLLDESTVSLPYLGSEGPTVLDIPIGISGQLTHLFIIFGMWGLAVKAIPFSNKVRVHQ